MSGGGVAQRAIAIFDAFLVYTPPPPPPLPPTDLKGFCFFHHEMDGCGVQVEAVALG